VLELLDKFEIYEKRDFYYYFHDKASYPPSNKRRKNEPLGLQDIDKSKLNWDAKVFSRDAVIIEINQSNVDRTGFGFVERALAELKD